MSLADVPFMYQDALTVLERLATAGALPAGAAGAQVAAPARPSPRAPAPQSPGSDEPVISWPEETLRALLESLPDAMVVIGSHGTIVMVNAQTERIFGYAREEMLGRPVEMLIPERFHQGHVGHRDGYFAAPRSRPMGAHLELFGRRREGAEFPVEISLSPLTTGNGTYATAVIRDISQRKRAEAKFRSLVENIPAVTFVAPLDQSAPELYVSPQIEALLGFSRRNGSKTLSSGIGNCTRRTANAGTISSPPPVPAAFRSIPSIASSPRTAGSSGCRAQPTWSATRRASRRSCKGSPSTSLPSRRPRRRCAARRKSCASAMRSWTAASRNAPWS